MTPISSNEASKYELFRLPRPKALGRSSSQGSSSDEPRIQSEERHSGCDQEASRLYRHSAKQRNAHNRRPFSPISLRRTFTGALTLVLLLFIATLVTLRILSKEKHGIDVVNSKLFYLWTYGPTAVFTCIAALWHALEFRTLQLTPWQVMFQRTKASSDSILIDYPSMWTLTAFATALRRGHFRVVMVILGAFLISALIITSTALFTTETSTASYSAIFHTVNAIRPPGNLNLTAVDEMPYTQAFLNMHLQTSENVGIHSNTIYDVFINGTEYDTALYVENSTYMADVHSLSMSMDCENGTIIANPRYDVNNDNGALDQQAMVSNTCNNTSSASLLSYVVQAGDYALWASIGCCSCGPDDGISMSLDSYGLQADNGQDWRLFLYASRFKTPQTSRSIPTLENSDFTAYICTPKSVARQAQITLGKDTSTDTILSNLTLKAEAQIPGMNDSSATQLLLGAWKSYQRFSGTSRAYNFLLNPGDDGHIDKFYDAEYLLERTQTALPRIMAQVAWYSFFTDSNTPTNGQILLSNNRLAVRDVTFGLLLGGLSVLSLIALASFVQGPILCCSRDPSSTGAIAAILSRSGDLLRALSCTGAMSQKALSSELAGSTVRSDGSAIQFSGNQSGGSESSSTWWKPMSSTIPLRVLIIGAPLIFVVLLEIGLQMSLKYGKVATVHDEAPEHYFWLYFPPLLIFLVRVLLIMVDENGRVFQPFFPLVGGNASADSTLFETLRGRPNVVAFWRALRRKYMAVIASTFAMFFAPALSIIVASLFISIPAYSPHAVSLRQMERWNFSDPTGSLYYAPTWYPGIDSGDSSVGVLTDLGQEGVLASMVLNQNLSFPKWTTSDFVLPTFEVVDGPDIDSANNITIQARVPAVRPNLNCQHIPAAVSSWSRLMTNVGDDSAILTNVTYAVSGLGDQDDNCGYDSNFTISASGLWFRVSPPQYYGESVDTRISRLNLTDRKDCPTRLMFLADLHANTVKAMACRPNIETVQVDATFNYPDFSFSIKSPPRIVSEPQIIHAGYFNTSHAMPENDISIGEINNIHNGISANNSAGLGDVFPSVREVEDSILGYGSNTFYQIQYSFGTSYEDMFNDPQLMLGEVQHLYGIMVGQVLHSYGVEKDVAPHGQDPGQAPIEAVLQTPDEQQDLVQNAIATRVLEALLLLMTLCMVLAIFLQQTRRVVPKEPEGIAHVMSLLAGASPEFWRLFNQIEGVEWMTDEETIRTGVFDDLKFRMGWSGSAELGDSRSGYKIVPAEDEEVIGADSGRFCVDIDQGGNSR